MTKPQECISKKVTTLHRLTANVFRRHLRPHGLTTSQLAILFVVQGMGAVRQKELGRTLEMEKSTVTRVVRRLLENDWIALNGEAELSLTECGAARVKQVMPAWRAAMKEIRGLLGEEGESAIDVALSKLRTTEES